MKKVRPVGTPQLSVPLVRVVERGREASGISTDKILKKVVSAVIIVKELAPGTEIDEREKLQDLEIDEVDLVEIATILQEDNDLNIAEFSEDDLETIFEQTVGYLVEFIEKKVNGSVDKD